MEILCSSALTFNMMRIGYSEDIHVLVNNRKLMLGGINVPSEKGEKAHSDGDVVLHALSEGMDSKIILKSVDKMMKEKGYHLVNADISIVLERPKIKDYVLPIRQSIADVLKVDIDAISVKAGTNEGVDEIGKGEAIKAVAVVLLESDD